MSYSLTQSVQILNNVDEKKKFKQRFHEFDQRKIQPSKHKLGILQSVYHVKRAFYDAESYLTAYGNEGDLDSAKNLIDKYIHAQERFKRKMKQHEERNQSNINLPIHLKETKCLGRVKQFPIIIHEEEKKPEYPIVENIQKINSPQLLNKPDKRNLLYSLGKTEKKKYLKLVNKNYLDALYFKQENNKRIKKTKERVKFCESIEVKIYGCEDEPRFLSHSSSSFELLQRDRWDYLSEI